jgi:anti-sigma-K factor RskA
MKKEDAHPTSSCESMAGRIDDYVDGLLPPGPSRELEEHLECCLPCRRAVDELERLLTAAAALPRSLEPERDLWPGIARRLEESAPGGAPMAFGALRQQTWFQALAAVLLLTLGIFLGRQLPTDPAVIDPPPAEDLRLVADESPTSAGFSFAEAELLRTKETLWLLAMRRDEELSPVTLRVVERNLRILDRAIEEIHHALENDPGNPHLEERLLDHHRRGVELLERLALADV